LSGLPSIIKRGRQQISPWFVTKETVKIHSSLATAKAIRRASEQRTECTMSDDPTKRDYRDRDRINVKEDYELQYWTKELGVTPEKLKQTVEKVGVMATDVRKALGKMKKDDEDGPGIDEGDTD
jgi:hypothetical protein